MARTKFALILLFLFILPINSAFARIDILPRKVVLDARERSAEITILNLFDQPSLYRLSIVHYRQNSDGTYETLEQPLSPYFDPEEHVRISPKQFKVNSGGRQKIRLSVRRPADLPDGEYRFHVVAKRFEVAEQAQTNNEGAKVTMKVNVAVAIPVVVRQGEYNATAEIAGAQYLAPTGEDPSHKLLVTVNREGNASTIGKLVLFRGDQQIGIVTNFNIFPEINQRSIGVPVGDDPRGKGPVRIVYMDDDDQIISEKTVQP